MAPAILGIAKAVYEYASQQPNPDEDDRELSIEENEMLYVLERGEDGWWKVKKKAEGDQEEGDEGLVPANYVEEATPIATAVAMYDYDRQTSEEVSFQEGSRIDIYDKEDSDWFLVGTSGQYGFAPSNYLEEGATSTQSPAVIAQQGPSGAIRPESITTLPPPAPPLPVAGSVAHVTAPSTLFAPPNTRTQPDFTDHTALESDDENVPPTPRRPNVIEQGSSESPPAMAARPARVKQATSDVYDPRETAAAKPETADLRMSRPYKTWTVQEVEGKKKKKKGTLGLGNNEISWAPDKASEAIQTWAITCLVNYSTEKKHVFIDLQGPPSAASFDFHAGTSDTATDIVTILGELVGAARAPGIREIAGALNAPLPALPPESGLARRERESGMPSRAESDDEDIHYPAPENDLPPGAKRATVMYDFEAQGADEVTVRAGAKVIVLDDRASPDWWKIRAGSKEGVIPADYLELRSSQKSSSRKSAPRESSTSARDNRRERSSSRHRAQELKPQATGGKSKPDPNKLRSWTDRSKSFKVEAQLLGCSDGKIHLHKSNGVKISVPVSKMCFEDIEYVEHKTGRSLQEDAPQTAANPTASTGKEDKEARRREAIKKAAASKPSSDFDWFDLFLACGCDPNVCQRYTSAFEREGFSEDDIGSLEPSILRNLGLKEGDILKVGRQIDARLGRQRTATPSFSDVLLRETTGTEGDGLLTGPSGELKNNTRRGRPERNVPAKDVVDSDTLRAAAKSVNEADASLSREDSEQSPQKPVRPQSTGRPAPSQAMEDLSLLDQPLIPVPATTNPIAQQFTNAAITSRPQQTASRPQDSTAFPVQQQSYPSQQFIQSIQQMQPQRTASVPAVPAFMPQTTFGSAIVAHKTGGGDFNSFVPPPLYPHQTGYQEQQRAMMQSMPPAQYQDPFKTGSAAPYQDPFKTGYAQVQPTTQQFQPNMQYQQTGLPFVPQQATGFYQAPMQTGFIAQPQQNGFGPQQTGFMPPQQQQQQYGFMQPSPQPFGFQSQQTGFNPAQPFGNSALPAFGGQLATQQTGFGYQNGQQAPFQAQQPTAFGGYNGFGAAPQQPQPQMSAGMLKMQQMMAEAQAQAPQQSQSNFSGQQQNGFQPVQFGRANSATPTGRRANLGNASAANPFGF